MSSMRDTFGQHHLLSEEQKADLWNQASFSLDASTMLNIYRYADATREDLFRVLRALTGRIWVPYQAAKEFYRNRIQVIREQLQKYVELEETLNKPLNGLREGSFRKSTFLRTEQIERILKPAINEAIDLVQA